MTVQRLDHLSSGAVWELPHVDIIHDYWVHQVLLARVEPVRGGEGLGDVGEAVLFLSEGVGIKPVLFVPTRQKPDISLSLGHGRVPSLTHHSTSHVLVKVSDDYPGSALLEVLQILKPQTIDWSNGSDKSYYRREVPRVWWKLAIYFEIDLQVFL